MTPFAKLGQIEKMAAAAPGYTYQKGKSGLNNPYTQQVSTTKTPSALQTYGIPAAELGADVVLGSNALTGVPWYLGKAIYQGFKGNWGNAATNLGMGALSFMPGAASAASVGKAAVGAGRIASAVGKYKGVMQAGQKAVQGGMQTARAVPQIGKAVDAYQSVAKPLGQIAAQGKSAIRGSQQIVKQPGIINNITTNAVPVLRAGAANTAGGAMALGGTMAKQAPMDFATSAIPNAKVPSFGPPPTAPAPTDSLNDYLTNIMINGPG